MGTENKSSKKENKNQSVKIANNDKNILQRIASFFVGTDNGNIDLLKILQEPQGTEEEQAAAIEELLKKGAKLKNIKNEDGETALIMAINWGNVPVTEVLLKHNADINRADNKGNTALMHAVMPHYTALQGFPPRYAASYKGHVQITEILINAGADINRKNKRGQTALMIAEEELKTFSGKHSVRDDTVRNINDAQAIEKIIDMLKSAGAK